ncbi:transketolase family protein [Prosthecobacter sp.]|jgi:transketolase|uniref:transketolase family protein n=1 Tax=Prosthecobacter sp. TaxID=1965333 RepID=UPI0037CB5D3C
MRTAFINELTVQARTHPEIFLIVGDLGFSVVEPFAREFPDRFLNAGVAEQNMTGVAAGLASEGYHVFTYSIANFPTLRCLEQIRNDVCYHLLPVTVVAVGGGLAYGNLGYSHHAVQDLAIMRTLPNIHVMAPGDPGETKECVAWLADHPGPSYLRIGKAGEKKLHDVRGIERGPLLLRGTPSDRIALVSTGGILDESLAAADILASEGKSVAVYSLPWLKPLDVSRLDALNSYDYIVAVEEHVTEGGLAAALRENLPKSLSVHSVAVSADASVLVGTQAFLRNAAGVSSSHIAATCLALLP